MNLKEQLEQQGVKFFKKNNTSYTWQVLAVDMWKKLNITGLPTKNWFKLFKTTFKLEKQGLLHTAYSITADARVSRPELYFYKVYWNKLKQ